MVPDTVNPLQFAYLPKQSVDNTVEITQHHTLQHLESSRMHARMLFMDYSSALNTIRPVKLTEKLTDLDIPTPTCN